MKKLLFTLVALFIISSAFGQLSFDVLLNSLDGIDDNSFAKHLQKENFKQISTNKKALSEKWGLGYDDSTGESDLIVEIKKKPYKSLWIESYRHPVYISLENEIMKRCEFGGFFGCSEVETWNSYKHSSGIEFRLIELPDSRETGLLIIEVLEK